MGMMCASNGWSVEASARIAILAPRRLRCRALARRRRVVSTDGMRIWLPLLQHSQGLTASPHQRSADSAGRTAAYAAVSAFCLMRSPVSAFFAAVLGDLSG